MKLIIGALSLLLSSFLPALPAHNLLIQKLDKINSLSASFTQLVLLNGRKVSDISGKFLLKKPGKIYWEINQPSRQLLVANGRQFWVYEPKLKQATVQKQTSDIGGAAGLFVSGKSNIWLAAYKVINYQQDKNTVFQLTAKSAKNSLAKIKLYFENDLLIRIDFSDQLGQYSEIKLIKMKLNQPISDSMFDFLPPRHADVINLG